MFGRTVFKVKCGLRSFIQFHALRSAVTLAAVYTVLGFIWSGVSESQAAATAASFQVPIHCQ